jgi:hypothetical protein
MAQIKARRGVAMIVVLGAVILFSLLGYVALNLSHGDNDIAGSLVDIKSQQIAAQGGLNLAVARFESNPTLAVQVLNTFLTTPAKAYLDFDQAGVAVAASSTATWHSLGPGSEAVQLKILGVSTGGTSGSGGGMGVDVALDCKGMGRDGNIHEVVSVFNVRGMDFSVVTTTSGPSDALHVQGTLGQIHTGSTIDGGIYSGSPSGTTVIENNASTITKLRIAGNLTTHQVIRVNKPSIIGGKLFLDDTNSLTFDSSLIVQGGMFVSGKLNVARSLYVSGGTQDYLNIGKVTVGDVFWVKDHPLNLTALAYFAVGDSVTRNGLVVLDSGVYFQTNSVGTTKVWGDLHVDDTSFFGAPVNIYGNYEYTGATLFQLYGNLYIGGNGYFGGEPFLNWSKNLHVVGATVFKKGVSGYMPTSWGTSSASGSINLDGAAWFYRASQDATPSGLSMVFGSSLKMNGTLTSAFKSTPGWSFASASTTPAKWSANVTGLTVGNQPTVSTIGNTKTNGFTTRTSDTVEPSVVPKRASLVLPTTASMGFTAADLVLSNTDPVNAASVVSLTSNTAFKGVETASNWETVKAEYLTGSKKTWCSSVSGGTAALGSYGKFPSAAMLDCIYAKEKNLGATSTHMWNSEYLILWLPPTYTDGNNAWMYSTGLPYTSDGTVGTLGAGTKIFFVVQQASNTTSWQWYANNPGSVQILYTEGNMSGFCWSGTIYGFLYFNYSGTSDQMFNGDKSMTLVGAWEITNPTVKVWFSQTWGSPGSLSITSKSSAAQTVFSDIGSNFNSSSVTGSNPVIVFNGGGGGGGAGSGSSSLKLYDGWLQFHRLGEFR